MFRCIQRPLNGSKPGSTRREFVTKQAAHLFRPTRTSRAQGRDGFQPLPLTRRSVQLLVERYVQQLVIDPAVTVHSLRVTALTTARERGSDIIDLQDFPAMPIRGQH